MLPHEEHAGYSFSAGETLLEAAQARMKIVRVGEWIEGPLRCCPGSHRANRCIWLASTAAQLSPRYETGRRTGEAPRVVHMHIVGGRTLPTTLGREGIFR
jgi:hypothetical protein